MRTRHRGLLVGAVALSLTGPVVAASAVPSTVTLAGTTVVTGSRTGSTLVRLPRAVDLTTNDIAIASPRGRMTGVVLKKVGAWNAPYVSVAHAGYCGKPSCAALFPNSGDGFIWTPGSTNGQSGRLPAGTYRLYLVTDGGAATFTFKFKGLSGTTRITPRSSARASVAAPAPTMAEPTGSPSLFAGGSAHRTPAGGGLNATFVWKEVPTTGAPSAVGVCTYEGDPKPGRITPAFQAPCESGSGGVPPFLSNSNTIGPSTTPLGPGRFLTSLSTGYLLSEGHWSLGGYHNTPGPVTAAYVHQLWLDF